MRKEGLTRGGVDSGGAAAAAATAAGGGRERERVQSARIYERK